MPNKTALEVYNDAIRLRDKCDTALSGQALGNFIMAVRQRGKKYAYAKLAEQLKVTQSLHTVTFAAVGTNPQDYYEYNLNGTVGSVNDNVLAGYPNAVFERLRLAITNNGINFHIDTGSDNPDTNIQNDAMISTVILNGATIDFTTGTTFNLDGNAAVSGNTLATWFKAEGGYPTGGISASTPYSVIINFA